MSVSLALTQHSRINENFFSDNVRFKGWDKRFIKPVLLRSAARKSYNSIVSVYQKLLEKDAMEYVIKNQSFVSNAVPSSKSLSHLVRSHSSNHIFQREDSSSSLPIAAGHSVLDMRVLDIGEGDKATDDAELHHILSENMFQRRRKRVPPHQRHHVGPEYSDRDVIRHKARLHLRSLMKQYPGSRKRHNMKGSGKKSGEKKSKDSKHNKSNVKEEDRVSIVSSGSEGGIVFFASEKANGNAHQHGEKPWSLHDTETGYVNWGAVDDDEPDTYTGRANWVAVEDDQPLPSPRASVFADDDQVPVDPVSASLPWRRDTGRAPESSMLAHAKLDEQGEIVLYSSPVETNAFHAGLHSCSYSDLEHDRLHRKNSHKSHRSFRSDKHDMFINTDTHTDITSVKSDIISGLKTDLPESIKPVKGNINCFTNLGNLSTNVGNVNPDINNKNTDVENKNTDVDVGNKSTSQGFKLELKGNPYSGLKSVQSYISDSTDSQDKGIWLKELSKENGEDPVVSPGRYENICPDDDDNDKFSTVCSLGESETGGDCSLPPPWRSIPSIPEGGPPVRSPSASFEMDSLQPHPSNHSLRLSEAESRHSEPYACMHQVIEVPHCRTECDLLPFGTRIELDLEEEDLDCWERVQKWLDKNEEYLAKGHFDPPESPFLDDYSHAMAVAAADRILDLHGLDIHHDLRVTKQTLRRHASHDILPRRASHDALHALPRGSPPNYHHHHIHHHDWSPAVPHHAMYQRQMSQSSSLGGFSSQSPSHDEHHDPEHRLSASPPNHAPLANHKLHKDPTLKEEKANFHERFS